MINDIRHYAEMVRLLKDDKTKKTLDEGMEVGFYFAKIWLPLGKLPREGEVVIVKNRRGVVHFSHFAKGKFRGLSPLYKVDAWRKLDVSKEDVYIDIEAAREAVEISKIITDPLLAIEEGYKRGRYYGQIKKGD